MPRGKAKTEEAGDARVDKGCSEHLRDIEWSRYGYVFAMFRLRRENAQMSSVSR